MSDGQAEPASGEPGPSPAPAPAPPVAPVPPSPGVEAVHATFSQGMGAARTVVVGYTFPCPGCGKPASVPIRQAAHEAGWDVKGDPEDTAKLTLYPAITNACCGWRGYLRDGAFTKIEVHP